MLTGRPLFPGKNVVHQLDLMTDLLGTPSSESLSRVGSLSLLLVFFLKKKFSYSLTGLEVGALSFIQNHS